MAEKTADSSSGSDAESAFMDFKQGTSSLLRTQQSNNCNGGQNVDGLSPDNTSIYSHGIRKYPLLSRQSSKRSVPASVVSRQTSTAIAAKQPTENEKKVLAGFSSVNYTPSHSVNYVQWLKEHPLPKFQFDRWTLLTMIGLAIGLTGWLQKQFLQLLDRWKWDRGQSFTRDDRLGVAFAWVAGISSIYIISGSFLVVFIHPAAAGSGVPEVISFLNGVIVHHTLSLKNFVVKFFANILAVASGIPCAIQGPIIAMGAVVGAGLGQFQSKSLGIKPEKFTRFRNAEDRRSFTTAGVAAGVAAAFNAPIGGLLFAMEDLSSFWSRRLCWQTFYTAGVAAITANLLNYPFTGFRYNGKFGLLSIAFTEPLQLHIAALLPAILLGLIGGSLGAAFTLLNTKITKYRKKLLAKLPHRHAVSAVRMSEVLLMSLIMVSVTVFLPRAFGCTEYVGHPENSTALDVCRTVEKRSSLEPYNCPTGDGNNVSYSEGSLTNATVATLMQGTGTHFLQQLWTRGVPRWFSYGQLVSILVVWYLVACWACGSALAGGIFVPNLVTGALYGRIVGLAMIDIYEAVTGDPYPVGTDWDWMDPGLIAVIGSGSMLGGVTRLCLAVTVIVVEMSKDLNLTVPILASIFTAKVIADTVAKPLYKYQLKGKMLPYLDPEPEVNIKGHRVSLDLLKVKDVMAHDVQKLNLIESVAALAKMLNGTEHCGFPVIQYSEESKQEVVYGFITRTELYVLLCSKDVYDEQRVGQVVVPKLEYEEISVDYYPDPSFAMERVRSYTRFQVYRNIFVNLESFINISAPKVDEDFSLLRSYVLFRTLGLRHLIIIDICNRVTGIITRKDLMGFHIQQRLLDLALGEKDLTSHSVPSSSYSGRSRGDSISSPDDFAVDAIATNTVDTKV